ASSVASSCPRPVADPGLIGHFTALWSGGLAALLAGWEVALGEKITEKDVEPLTWSLAELGRATPVVDYITAIALLTMKTRAVAQWWADGFDLLLTPTL